MPTIATKSKRISIVPPVLKVKTSRLLSAGLLISVHHQDPGLRFRIRACQVPVPGDLYLPPFIGSVDFQEIAGEVVGLDIIAQALAFGVIVKGQDHSALADWGFNHDDPHSE